MIIWMLSSGGGWVRKHHMNWWRSGSQDMPLRGWDDTRRGGTWDLIYAPWKWWEEWSGANIGWNQRACVGEWWWSGKARHLACINGQQPQAGLQCMHIFMTGYKYTGHVGFFSGGVLFFWAKGWAFVWASTHLHTGWPWHRICLHRYLALRLLLLYQNRPRLLTSRLPSQQTFYIVFS